MIFLMIFLQLLIDFIFIITSENTYSSTFLEKLPKILKTSVNHNIIKINKINSFL